MTYRHTTHLHGDYLDGHLTSDQTSAIDNHLSVCDACRADMHALRSLKNTLGNIAVPDPGDEYFDGLAATVDSMTQSPPAQRVTTFDYPGAALGRTLKTLIRLAAIVTLLFTAFYVSNIRQEIMARQRQTAPRVGKYAGAAGDLTLQPIQKGGKIKAIEANPVDSAVQPSDTGTRTIR